MLTIKNATLEILDREHSAMVDRVEGALSASGQFRFALRFSDLEKAIASAKAAGAELVSGPVETPWQDVGARLATPDGIPLTFFKSPPRTSSPPS